MLVRSRKCALLVVTKPKTDFLRGPFFPLVGSGDSGKQGLAGPCTFKPMSVHGAAPGAGPDGGVLEAGREEEPGEDDDDTMRNGKVSGRDWMMLDFIFRGVTSPGGDVMTPVRPCCCLFPSKPTQIRTLYCACGCRCPCQARKVVFPITQDESS